MVGRMDRLKSANRHIIHTFIHATLLGMALFHDLFALMRRKRLEADPSQYRVLSLLLMYLPPVIAALGTQNIRPTLEDFSFFSFALGRRLICTANPLRRRIHNDENRQSGAGPKNLYNLFE